MSGASIFIALDLANISPVGLPEELRRTFDPRRFSAADIYPGIWDEDPDELWEELSGYYSQLLAMYREAAAAGDAVIAWIS